jgi:tRNA-2-methylthio-N6-dimethylallyladenosine synthase
MNFHDSERIAGLLEQAGFERAEDESDADVLVLNTCSVRERAQQKLYSRLGELRVPPGPGPRPLIAVAGCVAQQEGRSVLRRAPFVDVVVGTQAIRALPHLVEMASAGNSGLVNIDPHDEVSFPLGLARRGDPVKAYVTIIEGCNDFCAFCVVPQTRGRERMRPLAEILAEVAEAAGSGRKEIHLLGQIVNHYQAPDRPGCDFTTLLESVHEIPGVGRIRFASPHPRHVTPRLIAAMRDLPKVCKHMHLPVQSGSSRILKAMRRRHGREEYLDLVDRLRDTVPGIALSTDIIVGFPGETAEDFQETLSLTARVRYHSMFSFKYSERPGTLAARHLEDDVGEGEKGLRLSNLQALQRSVQLELHQEAVGSRQEVLIDSCSRRRGSEVAGRTSGNTVVNLPGDPGWIGRTLLVEILRPGPNSLWGRSVAGELTDGG